MKRFTLLFVVASIIVVSNLFAQLPPYYNFNTNGENNSFPFNQAAGKMVQYLFLAGDFNTPTAAPSGLITKFYFRVGDTYPLSATYTNFYIRMGSTAITALPASFYAGTMDTVLFKASLTLTGAGGTWIAINLDKPFAYDNTQSLVVEIGQCASTQGTGFSVCNSTTAGMRRNWSTGGCPFTYISQNQRIINAGVLVVPNTPQYYNQNTGAGTNTYPWGQAPGQRVNWLIPSGSIINPSPVPSGGAITAIYFFMGNTSAPTTYTNFIIKMGQAAITALPPMWYAGTTDTVYYRATETRSSTLNSWMVIPLANPVNFNVAQALVLDIWQCGHSGTGMYVKQGSGPTGTRNYGTPAACPQNYAGQDGQIINFGVSMIFPVGNNNNNNNVPSSFKLEQNYPNPFNPVTNISYSIPKSSLVKLVVYDMLGREVAVLENTQKQAGSYTINFDASNLSSGVYLYKIEAGDFTSSKKMTLVK